MSKNTNKKAKFKPIEIELTKKVYKNILKKILNNTGTENILRGIKVIAENNKCSFAATDANTLIEVSLSFESHVPQSFSAVLDSKFLEKIKLNKSYEFTKKSILNFNDIIKITLFEDHAILTDVLNKIDYFIPYIKGEYPKYAQLFSKKINKKDYIRVGLSPNILNKISEMCGRDNTPVIMYINKESSETSSIFITPAIDETGINIRGLAMPALCSRKFGI
jgi:DNA polymerase III sliding clamp (beta) subunit (PCNA family)